MRTLLLFGFTWASFCFWNAKAEPPGNDLMNATTLEEFLAALQEYSDEASSSNPSTARSEPLLADSFGGTPGFYHSVASGDPLYDSVIVWTRYTPVNDSDEVTIELRMAMEQDDTVPPESLLDPDANVNLKRATIVVTAEHDWIAKVDVTNLPSGKDFVFCFVQGDTVSDVGQTKTAPPPDANVDALTYAVFSCAHFANGYFHAYDVASTIKDLDFWVHVGDYMYEYGLYSPYASDSEERKEQIEPEWETIDLQDHRLRQATYLLDEGFGTFGKYCESLSSIFIWWSSSLACAHRFHLLAIHDILQQQDVEHQWWQPGMTTIRRTTRTVKEASKT